MTDLGELDFLVRHPQKRDIGPCSSKVPIGTHLDILQHLPATGPSPEGFNVRVRTH